MMAPPERSGMRGFTIIELMVVVAIAATLMFIAAPDFTLFVANQRVRGVTSDLYHDLTMARSQAIALNRRVCLVPAAGGLSDGWTIVADTPAPPASSNDDCLDADDLVLTSSGPTPARIEILPNPAGTLPEATNPLTFLPNGEVMLRNPLGRGTPVGFQGITVCDNLGDTATGNNKVRTIYFGLTGRMRVDEHRLDPTGDGVCL